LTGLTGRPYSLRRSAVLVSAAFFFAAGLLTFLLQRTDRDPVIAEPPAAPRPATT
jgi:hypothetical protein